MADTVHQSAANRRHIIARGKELGLVAGIVRAFGYLDARERGQVMWVMLLTLVNALLGLVGLASILPFFQLLVLPDPLARGTILGELFHVVGINSELIALVAAGLAVIVLILAKNVFSVLYQRVVGRFTAAFETRLATDMLRRIVDAPFDWYLKQNTSVLRDVVMAHIIEMSRGVVRPALTLANNGLMLLTALALMLPFTPLPAIAVALVTSVIGWGLIRLARPKIAIASQRKRQAGLVAGIAATEAITGGRDVRMSRAGTFLKREFGRSYSAAAYSDADARQWQLVPRSGIEIIGMSALIAIALVALLTGMSRLDVATMLALYAVVAVRLLPVISETANTLSVVQMSLPALSYLDETRASVPVPPEHDTTPLQDEWSALELRDVSFSYSDGATPALHSVTTRIERCRSYGIVGSSGAGKSTLADLLAGLLTPSSGDILLDGVPLTRSRGLASWRDRVSYVAQAPIIFDISFAENVTLGEATDGSDERLLKAIKAAGLTDVAASLDQGLQTPIGDRGTRLSGGQRQRVAIARAIFRETDILILDEATSALDSLTEQEVGEAIDNLKGDVTVIAIAHRLATIMHCDEILVMEGGTIEARGTHASLMATSEAYRRQVGAQTLDATSN